MKPRPWTVREVNYRMPDGSLKHREDFTEEEFKAMWARMEERAMRAAGYEKIPEEGEVS